MSLPTEHEPKRTSQNALVAIAILVLSIFGLNLLLWFVMGERPINRGYWVIKEKWNLLRSAPEPVDWLIVGDSSCDLGLDPEVISSVLGGSAINLCTVASTTVLEDAWMIEEYLSRFPAPKGIIVGHTYDIWARTDQNLRSAMWLIDSDPAFWRSIQPPMSLSLEEGLALRLSPWVPFLSQARSVEALVLTRGAALSRPRFEMDERGWSPRVQADPDFVRADSKLHAEAVRRLSPELAARNREALQFIVNQADSHEVPIWIVQAPLHDALWRDEAFRDFFDRTTGLIKAEVDRSARVHLLLEEPALYPAERMQNADHVAGEAISDYSERVARAVARTRGF